MNPTLQFYVAMLAFINNNVSLPAEWNRLIRQARKASGLSWHVSRANLSSLFIAVTTDVNSTEDTRDNRLHFLFAAFRDLSQLKDPKAMEIFQELRSLVTKNYDEESRFHVWGKKVTQRPDGSAVVTLHVSNINQLMELLRYSSIAGRNEELSYGLMTRAPGSVF